MARALRHRAKAALDIGDPAPAVADDLVRVQYARIGAIVPVLYFSIALIAVVAGAASGGDFDIMYHVMLPAGFVSMGCFRSFIWYRRKSAVPDIDRMRGYLRTTTWIALGLAFVGSLWTMDAYNDTRETRRILAPVFIFMITFAGAICLTSLPRAAIGVMALGVIPMLGIMFVASDPGIQAMAVCFSTVSLLIMALIVSSFKEIVSGLELRHELKTLSETDSLTGLANRRAFTAQFEHVASGLAPRRSIAIVMIDLDGFKLANDRYGHDAGDAILVQAGERLTSLCPDAASIARLGGDEFALLVEMEQGGGFCPALKAAVRSVLSLPYQHRGRQIAISASVGAALSTGKDNGLERMMRDADQDMYGAKPKTFPGLRA
jgi:diguanylate cyclase (GGDEF)-like protein